MRKNIRHQGYLFFLASLIVTLVLLVSCSDDAPLEPEVETTGTIVVTIDPDEVEAPWVCTRIDADPVAGTGDSVLVEMTPGIYVMAWGVLEGCLVPEPDTLTLAAADTVFFNHEYICFPPPPPLLGKWLFDVGGDGTGDVYAGGKNGVLFHYNGSDWTRINSGFTSTIVEIWTDTDETVWAVGNDGLVLTMAGTETTQEFVDTDENLFSIGRFEDRLYVGGQNGSLFRRNSGVWTSMAGSIVMRDHLGSPTDTLDVGEDVAAFTTISHHFLGGAFVLPDWEGEPLGMEGTDGMVLTTDTEFDWWLQPHRRDLLAESEWVLCSTSDPFNPDNNWLGTSEGWLSRFESNDDGQLRWLNYPTRLSAGSGEGIRDLWLVPGGHLYLVNDSGQIIYLPQGGDPVVLYEQELALMSIWGTGPDEFFVTGLMEAAILNCSHDPFTGELETELVDLSGQW